MGFGGGGIGGAAVPGGKAARAGAQPQQPPAPVKPRWCEWSTSASRASRGHLRYEQLKEGLTIRLQGDASGAHANAACLALQPLPRDAASYWRIFYGNARSPFGGIVASNVPALFEVFPCARPDTIGWMSAGDVTAWSEGQESTTSALKKRSRTFSCLYAYDPRSGQLQMRCDRRVLLGQTFTLTLPAAVRERDVYVVAALLFDGESACIAASNASEWKQWSA
jgi:hypothetical protein